MSSMVDPGSIEASIQLGRVWLERGQEEAAAAHLERALASQPDHPDGHRYLAYLRVRQGNLNSALEHITLALRQAPPESPLHNEASLLRAVTGSPPQPVDLPDNPDGRLRFTSRYDRSHHRSGWRYAVEALHPLHHTEGVLFESFLEDPFAWQHPQPGIRTGADFLRALRKPTYQTRLTSEERHIVPFREPWVGFLHNPPNMPRWFHYQESPQSIFAKSVWQESLKHCIGLFTLSEYAACWLRQATGKPVSAVLHPTETPTVKFDFERFLANPQKKIVQVGWWLRRLAAIDRLPVPANNPLGLTKLRLIPNFFHDATNYLQQMREREFHFDGQPEKEYANNTIEQHHLSNAGYDQLLAENIGFVNLYDASANNTVIECLVRATPLMVNRLPAVEEYLGSDYPLYYSDLADAAAKALDLGRLRAAHDYLVQCETRDKLDRNTFRHTVEQSEVYQLL